MVRLVRFGDGIAFRLIHADIHAKRTDISLQDQDHGARFTGPETNADVVKWLVQTFALDLTVDHTVYMDLAEVKSRSVYFRGRVENGALFHFPPTTWTNRECILRFWKDVYDTRGTLLEESASYYMFHVFERDIPYPEFPQPHRCCIIM
jgi:hypothetical protein